MSRIGIALLSAFGGVIAGVWLAMMMCAVGWRFDPQVWGTGAQWAGAFASTCAVVVAIWGDRIRRRLSKPRLLLELKETEGVDALTSVIGSDNKPLMPRNAKWLHITASNPTRWFAAKEVSVYVLRVDVCEMGEWAEAWIGLAPLNWRHDYQPSRSLGPSWDADVIRIFGNELAFAMQEGIAQPAGFPRAGPVELRLRLQARGLDLDSPTLSVTVSWDGKDPDSGGRLRASLEGSKN